VSDVEFPGSVVEGGVHRALTVQRRRPARLTRRAILGVLALASVVVLACSTSDPGADGSGDGGGAQAARSEDAAPDFALDLFGNENHAKGELITLSQYLGQPVVVNFWYPSCPPCRLEMPDLEATFQKHKDDGVQFIGVQALVLDTVEEGQEFIDEFGITYAIGPDTETQILIDYGVANFPTTVFLDKNHNVVRKWAGILTAEKLDELIEPLLQ
jgi:cytochrome c biogenesis protein CcmG/thiol:disulfide interchange protein DsbE